MTHIVPTRTILTRTIPKFFVPVLVSILLATVAMGASARDLPCTLQLGRIPLLPDGRGWAVAVPLGSPPADCRLITRDPALSLRSSPDGRESWLAFQSVGAGSVSGLLEIASSAGRPAVRIAVAGEVVACTIDNLPTLLVVSGRGEERERRYLQMRGLPAPVTCSMERTGAAVGAAIADGWVPVEILPGARLDESRGRLSLDDGKLSIPVQYSVEQSITVLAQSDLGAGWSYDAVIPFGEVLREGRLRGSVAVVGRRDGGGVLRTFSLSRERGSGNPLLRRMWTRELPGYDGVGKASVVPVRVRDLTAGPGRRERRLLTVSGGTAGLWSRDAGLLTRRTVPGFRATNAVAASRRHRAAVFALRRERSSGLTYLRRWFAEAGPDGSKLTGKLSEAPLEQRLGIRSLRSFDLSVRRDSSSERLLLLAGRDAGKRVDSPVSLYSLRLDPDDPSRIVSARRRFTTRLSRALGDPEPHFDMARSHLIGGRGYPIQVRAGMADLTPSRHIDIRGAGESFVGGAFVADTRHSVRGGAFPLVVPSYIAVDNIGAKLAVRHSRFEGDGSVLLAAGEMLDLNATALSRSRRLRHVWMVTAEPGGGVGARHQLRLLTAGIDGSVNLPPRADAGGDLSSRAYRVDLAVDATDPNGDPLAVRWSAPGIEFSDPTSPRTSARFPAGITPVRVTVTESGGQYETADIVRVAVNPLSSVEGPAGLTTRISGLYPNPANPQTRVAFTVDRAGPVRISVHDLAGRLVRELLDDSRGTGAYDVVWDGADAQGRSVASGVYVVRLQTAAATDEQRAVIVR